MTFKTYAIASGGRIQASHLYTPLSNLSESKNRAVIGLPLNILPSSAFTACGDVNLQLVGFVH